MKKVIFLATLCIYAFTYGQNTDDIKRFRLGAKAGVPNGIGGNVEIVTPLLVNSVALYGDYSGLSAEIDDTDTTLKYYEFGANVYFKQDQAKGLYAAVGYGNLSMDGVFTDAQTINGELFTGTAEGSFDVQSINVKLGILAGRTLFFRAELGYGFGDVPQEIRITGNVNGVPSEGVEEIPDIPGVGENGYILANIGIGIAF